MGVSKYVWSKFLVKVHFDHGILVRNTASGAVVFLTNYQHALIEDWLSGVMSTQIEDMLPALTNGNDILVEANRNESLECLERFQLAKSSQDVFTVHFLPTMKCQLRCHYCFERGVVRKENMSQQMANSVVDWLLQYLNQHTQCTNLRFVLFGGEPLLRFKLIKQVIERLSHEFSASSIKSWVEVITNGVLFTQDVVKELLKFNLRRVQITLDGPQVVHDGRRFGPNNQGTFTTIIENIEHSLELDPNLKIDLRLTLDKSNAESVPVLLLYLSERKLVERLNLSIGLTSPTLEQLNLRMTQEEAASKILNIWRIAKSLGFEIPEEYSVGPLCIATTDHSVVIEPDGSFQKCFCLVGREKYRLGSLATNRQVDIRDVRFLHLKERTTSCMSEGCNLLPLCGGGCIHNSLTTDNDGFQKRFCEHTLVEKVNEGLLRLNYEDLV